MTLTRELKGIDWLIAERRRLERENRYLRRILKAWFNGIGLYGCYPSDLRWPYRMTEALFRKDKK